MTLIHAKCIEYHDTRKICTAYENGKKYTLNNNSGFKIKKVKLDKCLDQGHGEKRCDYLMDIELKKGKRVIFIELKGSGLSDAVKQLYSTIDFLKVEFKSHQCDVRIIGSRDVPGIRNSADFAKLERQIRSTKGSLKIATSRIYIENI